MIEFSRLDERLFVAGQLHGQDMPAVAAAGFRTIVNNRPDGEAWMGQPSSAEIDAAAGAAGLASHYLPIALKALGAGEVRAFDAVLRADTGPVLAFCKSGFRCALLWAMREAGCAGRSLDIVLRQAMDAGHDLSGQRALIERVLAEIGEAGR